MNQDPQDELIRGLFAQLERDERERVPSFAAVLDRARSRRRSQVTLRLSFSFAIAVVMTIAFFFGMRWFGGRSDNSNREVTAGRGTATPDFPTPQPAPLGRTPVPGSDDPLPVAPPTLLPSKKADGSPRNKDLSKKLSRAPGDGQRLASNDEPRTKEPPAQSDRTRLATETITAWRSPTDFLLRTPGDEFIRSVPRLDDSVVQVKRQIDKN